ncbi:hypothetical protein EDD17DRAFT_1580004 [Pisolithus thermaeus]|nr:hypothetical protein EDD17DRAFT_1580004 [Pisolithus thermaeus]
MPNSKHTVLLKGYKASLDGWNLITFYPRQLAAGPTAPHLSLSTMIAHDSADARTALMASYFSRYLHPRAGKKPIASHSPLQRRKLNIPEGLSPNPVMRACDATLSLDRDRLAMRGRTIYNAKLAPSDADSTRGDWLEGVGQQSSLTALEQLQRIDAEEMMRKELFAMMVMGCSACSGRYLTQEGVSLSDRDEATTVWQVREGDDRAVREMFDMYIRMEECMG